MLSSELFLAGGISGAVIQEEEEEGALSMAPGLFLGGGQRGLAPLGRPSPSPTPSDSHCGSKRVG